MEKDNIEVEDKEFIKSLKTQCKGAREILKDNCCQLPISYIEKIIDIVEKQQKEIEELKEEIKRQGNTREIEEKFVEDNFISKDKIRELINKRNSGIGYTSLECIEDIEKLLEE